MGNNDDDAAMGSGNSVNNSPMVRGSVVLALVSSLVASGVVVQFGGEAKSAGSVEPSITRATATSEHQLLEFKIGRNEERISENADSISDLEARPANSPHLIQQQANTLRRVRNIELFLARKYEYEPLEGG